MSGNGSTLLACCLAWALVGAACTAPATTPASDIDTNGSINLGVVDRFGVIDPQLAVRFDTDVRTVNLVFETLLSLDPKTLRPASGAADLPAISADGLVYHFTLRVGLAYSDGQPVTAADYGYGIGRLCDPTVNSAYAISVSAIVGCERWTALDPRTTPPAQLAATRREVFTSGIVAVGPRDLEIRLREPAPYLPSVLALWVAAPVREQDLDRYGPNWYFDPKTYIGNGPFVLTEWILAKRAVFERNPRFRTPPKVKRLTLSVFADAQEALTSYRDGVIDRLTVNDADLLQSITASGLQRELSISPGSCTYYLRLNDARPPLDDPKVRLALAKSIDREAYVREIRGFGTPATSFIAAGLPGHDPSDTAQSYDLAAAKQALSESRYASSDMLRTLAWTTPDTTPALVRRELEWFAKQWQALGIDVPVVLVDGPTLGERNKTLANRQFFLRSRWCADYADQADWFSIWFTAKAQRGGADFGYRNPAVDAALSEADRGTDAAKRDELYLRVSRTLSADVPWIWLTYSQSAALVKPWVGGLNANAIDFGGIFHPGEIFVRPH